MFVCEFQNARGGAYFGRSEHPDRATAEQHATMQLIALGEDPADVRRAVSLAGHACADTRSGGYGVRITQE